jgi:hypothetical protein
VELPKTGPSENRIPLKIKHLALVQNFSMAKKKRIKGQTTINKT